MLLESETIAATTISGPYFGGHVPGRIFVELSVPEAIEVDFRVWAFNGFREPAAVKLDPAALRYAIRKTFHLP